MSAKTLIAESRDERGKNANRRLRAEGFIPAVLYSHGESEALKIQEKEFFKLFHGHISESVIFDVKISGGSEAMAFVKTYQSNPVTDEVIHVDLYKVTKGEKIHTQVPLEIVGTPKGTKLGGLLEISEREIEVECLPQDLPEKLEVDVTELVIGQSIHAKDLDLGDAIKLRSNGDVVIAAVHETRTAKADSEEESVEVSEEASSEE